jgi:hypothetical protein
VRRADSESSEIIDGEDEEDGASDGNLDGGTEHSGLGGVGFEHGEVDDLFSGLAVIGEDVADGLGLVVFDPDEEGGVSFAEKAAGGSDQSELKSLAEEFIGESVFIPVVNDADGEFHLDGFS